MGSISDAICATRWAENALHRNTDRQSVRRQQAANRIAFELEELHVALDDSAVLIVAGACRRIRVSQERGPISEVPRFRVLHGGTEAAIGWGQEHRGLRSGNHRAAAAGLAAPVDRAGPLAAAFYSEVIVNDLSQIGQRISAEKT